MCKVIGACHYLSGSALLIFPLKPFPLYDTSIPPTDKIKHVVGKQPNPPLTDCAE